jgi:WXXGXW repeat (2 copies)
MVFFSMVTTSCAQRLVIRTRPVAPTIIIRPNAPSARHVWMDGEWVWNGRGYVYREGYWVIPNRGRAWKAGHWKRARGGWYWVPGRWGR